MSAVFILQGSDTRLRDVGHFLLQTYRDIGLPGGNPDPPQHHDEARGRTRVPAQPWRVERNPLHSRRVYLWTKLSVMILFNFDRRVPPGRDRRGQVRLGS